MQSTVQLIEQSAVGTFQADARHLQAFEELDAFTAGRVSEEYCR